MKIKSEDEYSPDPGMVALFKAECDDRSAEIDPDDEHDWKSLTLGWAVAKGMKPEEAQEFASYIRYRTELG